MFKVQTNSILNRNKDEHIKIFHINRTITVQQKLAGYLAHQLTSVEAAKKLFDVEVEGLAGFVCTAGLVNGRTGAFKMDKLKAKLHLCQRPLQLTEELRKFMTTKTPPPAVPSPLPPGLFSPRSPPAPESEPWRVGGITPAGEAPAGPRHPPSEAGNVGVGLDPGLLTPLRLLPLLQALPPQDLPLP